MKDRIKHSAETILMLLLCLHSASHPEKYGVIIPIMFGAIALLGIILIISDKK